MGWDWQFRNSTGFQDGSKARLPRQSDPGNGYSQDSHILAPSQLRRTLGTYYCLLSVMLGCLISPRQASPSRLCLSKTKIRIYVHVMLWTWNSSQKGCTLKVCSLRPCSEEGLLESNFTLKALPNWRIHRWIIVLFLREELPRFHLQEDFYSFSLWHPHHQHYCSGWDY